MIATAALSKFFLGKKSKIFIGVILALLLASGFLFWRYDAVSKNLTIAEQEIHQVSQELVDSENTVDELRRDIILKEKLLADKERARVESEKRSKSLSEALEEEKQSNEGLQECLSIDMSGYVDRVLQFPAYQNSNKD